MRIKPYLLIPVAVLSLSACVKAPTLEERLADKTGAEREKEAYHACLERARYPVPGGHTGGYIGHETRMWSICDAMHETNLQENDHAAR
jgi:hypothetical protein